MRTAFAALDHLVLATPDLVETTTWVDQATGVRPSPGGPHIGKGTRNMLCSLGHSSYLEIVGPDPDQPDPAGPRPFGIDDLIAPAMVSWAVAVPDIDLAIETARAAGIDPGPATPMQRLRPDGVLLSWRLTASLSRTVPFLIDWGESPHPARTAAPGLELVELRASHPDPSLLAEQLEALGVSIGIAHGHETLLVQLVGPLGGLDFM